MQNVDENTFAISNKKVSYKRVYCFFATETQIL